MLRLSLPSWECGLKFLSPISNQKWCVVTPFVGVWIEIQFWLERKWNILVTPFVGVWIEIFCYYNTKNVLTTSLPSWECGLKFL